MRARPTFRYVAFLRGINVGGNKLIKMEELRRVIEGPGFANVRTFIASGNLIFDSAETDASVLARKIERILLKAFGHEIAVVVIALPALALMVRSNPFRPEDRTGDVMLCVVFFTADPPKLKLPIESLTDNLSVFAVRNRTAFVVCRRKKSGWFGFPNNFVEEQFGVTATTRQWRTVEKIVTSARGD